MSRSRTILILAAAIATLAGSTVAALATTPAPKLNVHAIFSGGARAPWHVGQVLQVIAGSHSSVPICWSPAPIDRPACSPGNAVGAPSAIGTTTITIKSGGVTRSTKITVVAARTHYDGQVGVAGVVRRGTPLYGNYDTHHDRFHSKMTVADLRPGQRVGVYNRLGKRAVFVWRYADNAGGFVPIGDVTPVTGSITN